MCFVLNGCPKEQHILVNWTADRPDLCTKSTKFRLGDNWKSAVPIRNVRSVTQASACISKSLGRVHPEAVSNPQTRAQSHSTANSKTPPKHCGGAARLRPVCPNGFRQRIVSLPISPARTLESLRAWLFSTTDRPFLRQLPDANRKTSGVFAADSLK
jgi:hypothetical protein